MSWRRTPEIQPATALKRRERTRRRSGSCRRLFQPETRSKPSSSLTSRRGISAGSSWRSPSIVTITSPRACAKPAARAAALPKLRRSRTTVTLSWPRAGGSARRTSRRSSRRRRRRPPTACRAAGAPSRARRGGGRRSAPRCAPGRRRRSRARAYPGWTGAARRAVVSGSAVVAGVVVGGQGRRRSVVGGGGGGGGSPRWSPAEAWASARSSRSRS